MHGRRRVVGDAGQTSTEYFDRNPGVLDRAPKIGVLIPTVTAEQVAASVARAVAGERREVVLPFMLRFFLLPSTVSSYGSPSGCW